MPDHEDRRLLTFLIACYTGLRFSDVGRLNALYLKQSGNQYLISMVMKKTRKPVEIPLSNRVVKLLMKRIGVDYTPVLADVDLLGHNEIFSRKLKQSNSRVNTDVREIIAMQKIDKYITFHCSRHSFAINYLIHRNHPGSDFKYSWPYPVKNYTDLCQSGE